MLSMASLFCRFQSTLPCGSDYDYTTMSTQRVISIHAPLRERRTALYGRLRSSPYFNPRSLTGATGKRRKVRNAGLVFQSTLPHRSDDKRLLFITADTQFQSTLPHGSDDAQRDFKRLYAHFNPRSLTGATALAYAARRRLSYFNPRSLTGATRERINAAIIALISIHAPSRERHCARRDMELSRNFNPRSLTGATTTSAFH